MPIDFSFLEGDASQGKNTPSKSDTANVTIRVDADSLLLCDGEYIDHPLKAGVITKIQLPLGQHLLEFLYAEDPDIKVEKEVDFPEAGKSYLVIIKDFKDLVDKAKRIAAEEEAKRKAAEAEAKRKAEAEAKARKEAEIKRIADLAEDYYNGSNGKSKDYEQAVAHYLIAAESGHTNSQYSLGWCYEHGQGVEKSVQDAEKWYRKAAEQRETKVKGRLARTALARMLGTCYYFGENGKSKDYGEAVVHLSIAAEAGDAYSQYLLGFCHEKGQGVEQSLRLAAKWYIKAAEQGEKNAKERLENAKQLGNDYYDGSNGKSKNYEKAVEYYRLAAEAGDAYAQYSLGRCFEKGQGIEQCLISAAMWYSDAAKQGEAHAKERLRNAKSLGYDYYFGKNGKSKDYRKAVAHLSIAARNRDAFSQYLLGMCYEYGNGVEQNRYIAEDWYRKAAKNGFKR